MIIATLRRRSLLEPAPTYGYFLTIAFSFQQYNRGKARSQLLAPSQLA
jgi:hypothetical protein